MANSIHLIGRITHNLELKQTSGGKSFLTLALAVDRTYKDSSGNKKTDFFKCVFWDKGAELVHEYCEKGSKLYVLGSMKVDRDWETH